MDRLILYGLVWFWVFAPRVGGGGGGGGRPYENYEDARRLS